MVTGVIKAIPTRQWQDKVMYSISLVNDPAFYGCGVTKPTANVGDLVEFTAEKNSKGYPAVVRNTLRVVNQAPTSPQVVSNAPASTALGTSYNPQRDFASKDTYWKDKEQRDLKNDKLRSLGAARNTAIEWIKFLVEKEAVPLPKTIAKREETLNALLNDYTDKFQQELPEAAPKSVVPAVVEAPSEDAEIPWQ